MRLAGHSPYRVNKPPAGSILDTSHPLGRDLLAAWMNLEGGGRTYFDSGQQNWGYTYNGTLTWTPSQRIVPAQPVFGPALTFDGSTSFVSFPRISSFRTMVGGGPFTASVWFMTSVLGSRRFVCADYNSGGTTQSYGISIGRVSAGTNNHIAVLDDQAGTDYDTGIVMTALNWYHVVTTWDRVRWKISVNGVVTNDVSKTSWTNGTTFTVGRPGAFNGLYWQGQIGPQMVYSRVLSPDEVKWLYAEPFSMLLPSRPMRFSEFTKIKTIDGLAKGAVKTVDGLAIGSMETWLGLP